MYAGNKGLHMIPPPIKIKCKDSTLKKTEAFPNKQSSILFTRQTA